MSPDRDEAEDRWKVARGRRTLVSIWTYLERRWPELVGLTLEHMFAVALAVGLATVIGVALGCLVYRNDRAVGALLNVTSTLFTIPALAYFGLLVALLGLGLTPTIVVLFIYALLPIVRNTVTGLREVDKAIVRSARGMGMSNLQRLMRIELPLAWPVVISGIRVGTILIVGIAAIGSYVDGPGLGSEIFGGLGALGSVRAVPQAVAGTVGVVLVALVLDGLLVGVSRLTTPKGIR